MRGFLSDRAEPDKAQRSSIIDLALTKIHETKLALLLSDGLRQAWVPKSQVEDYGDGTFAMPENLAKEKGFL